VGRNVEGLAVVGFKVVHLNSKVGTGYGTCVGSPVGLDDTEGSEEGAGIVGSGEGAGVGVVVGAGDGSKASGAYPKYLRRCVHSKSFEKMLYLLSTNALKLSYVVSPPTGTQ